MTNLRRHLTRPHRHASRGTSWLAGIALAVLTACATDQPSAVQQAAPARLAFRANVAATSANLAQVRASVAYLRQAGAPVTLGTAQLITLGAAATQQVPIAIDMATCLADPSRAGSGGSAAEANVCVLRLELDYLLDGARVDRQVITGLVVRPGQVSTVNEPVALYEVSDVQLVIPSANVGGSGTPVRLEMEQTMALGVRVLDANGQPITGRPVTWQSSDPAVLTVSAAGVVTPVAPGTAQVSAEVAGRLVTTNVGVVAASRVVSITATGTTGSGTITSAPAGLACTITGAQTTGTCAFTFPGNTTVQLTATTGTASDFIGFTGDCTGASCAVTTSAARTVGVAFRARLGLSVGSTGVGTGRVTASSGAIDCTANGTATSGTCTDTYAQGASVTLTAAPTNGSVFQGWTGACTGAATTCVVQMDGARAVVARFDRFHTLTVTNASGSGRGAVSSAPEGVACTLEGANRTGACAPSFLSGTEVTLQATPAPGHVFDGWSGACTGTGPCTVTMSDARTVTATFRLVTRQRLTITIAGGGGTVTSSIGGGCTVADNAATTACVIEAITGQQVQLTAVNGENQRFAAWSGDCTGSSACTVTLDRDRAVTATFTRRQVQLSLQLAGTGAGTITTDAGQTCTLAEGESARACTFAVDAARPITLTRTTTTGSAFEGWGGACSGTAATCTITPTTDATVTGQFRLLDYIVEVFAEPGQQGLGMVLMGAQRQRCAITPTGRVGLCTLSVTPGQSITLRIDPSIGTPFLGWGDACASFGTAEVCTITPRGNREVTVRFQPQ